MKIDSIDSIIIEQTVDSILISQSRFTSELTTELTMGWLRLVGSIKLHVSFAQEPYKREDILQKRPIILSILSILIPQSGFDSELTI